jgi:hypothetical protein
MLQVLDRFEWNYTAAMAQALATTVSPSLREFLRKETIAMRVLRQYLRGPTFTVFIMLLWVPAKVVVMLGKLALSSVNGQNSDRAAALYRFAVDRVFFFFTVPMYILTHLTYYL